MEFFRKFKGKDKKEPSELSADDILAASQRALERKTDETESGFLSYFIKRKRRESGMSLNDLSSRTGIRREDLIDIELGTLPLSETVSLLQRFKHLIGIKDNMIDSELFQMTKKRK